MSPFLPTTSFNGTSTRRRQVINEAQTGAGSGVLIRLLNVISCIHGVMALID